jgi:hypothetical protein
LIRANVPRRAQKARGTRDEAAVNEAIERYRNGETLWAIANDLGKTATTVRSWLVKAGVERRRPGVAINRDSLQETVRLYESGMTIDEVAHEQGLHPWTVRQRLVNAKVPRRRRGRRPTRQSEPNMARTPAETPPTRILDRPDPTHSTSGAEGVELIEIVGGPLDEFDGLPAATPLTDDERRALPIQLVEIDELAA